MDIEIFQVEVEFRGRRVVEYLVCGVTGGPPLRFLSGSVAGAVAASLEQKRGFLIAQEDIKHWLDQGAVRRWFFLSEADRQFSHERLVFNLDEKFKGGGRDSLGYLALTRSLRALSPVSATPAEALGLPEGTWGPPEPI